jgi:hypothetical protein
MFLFNTMDTLMVQAERRINGPLLRYTDVRSLDNWYARRKAFGTINRVLVLLMFLLGFLLLLTVVFIPLSLFLFWASAYIWHLQSVLNVERKVAYEARRRELLQGAFQVIGQPRA